MAYKVIREPDGNDIVWEGPAESDEPVELNNDDCELDIVELMRRSYGPTACLGCAG